MSQGTAQPRANINVDIDFIASEIVRADDEFAPDLRDMYMDLSFTLIEARFPQLHQALAECGSGYNLKASPECAAVYIEGMFGNLRNCRQLIKYGAPSIIIRISTRSTKPSHHFSLFNKT